MTAPSKWDIGIAEIDLKPTADNRTGRFPLKIQFPAYNFSHALQKFQSGTSEEESYQVPVFRSYGFEVLDDCRNHQLVHVSPEKWTVTGVQDNVNHFKFLLSSSWGDKEQVRYSQMKDVHTNFKQTMELTQLKDSRWACLW